MVPGERLFRLLLYLYPPPFRKRFEDELLRFFREDRLARGASVYRFWSHTILDLLRTAAREWWEWASDLRWEMDMHSYASLRMATRSARRNGRVTILAGLTLALGIGASTAILSVTKAVLLDPLPYRDPDRLALVWAEMPRSDFTRYPISGPELLDLRTRSEHFEDFASIWTTTGALVEENEPETVRLALVTWNFPSILGASPVLGRSFEPAEEGGGRESVVLLSEELWQRRFGGERSVLGKTIRIDGGWGFPGGRYKVIGVLPASFRLVLPADAGVATHPDVWVPFAYELASRPRDLFFLRTVGRIRTGSTVEEAREEIRAIGEAVQSEFPEYDATGRAFNVVSLKGDAVARARPVILALLTGTGFLLLITCANVANLLLARSAERQNEMMLRSALGASRGKLALQLLAESLVLAALGGVLGVFLGSLLLDPLLALSPAGLPRSESIAADPVVLAVALSASLLCGFLFGLAPVLQCAERQLYSALRSGSRISGGGARARSLLIVAELALAFVLSAGATLCFRTLQALEQVDLGFATEGVLTMELTLPGERYGTGAKLASFTRELERRLSQIPGVEAAGAINQLPLSDLPNWSSPYRVRAEVERSEGETNEADGRVVTPGYFEAVGAKLLEGRLFDAHDDATSRPVVIVDELLAARAWPGQRALGQEIQVEVRKEWGFVPTWAEVVGVVQHMRHHDPRFEIREQFFVPFAQGARNQMGLAVRARANPLELLDPVREEIAALDRDLAITRVRLLEDYARDARDVERFTMVLAAIFAVMAVVLGSLGLYGVVAYAVSCREREIGLRVALGSTSSRIARWVLGQGFVLVVAGVGLGLAGSLAAGGLLKGLLFGVAPNDPVTLTLVPLVLAAVALAASWVPARRATRVDPAVVLRQE